MSSTKKPVGRPQTGAARFQQVAAPPKKSAGESLLAALALAALVLGVPALLLTFNGPPPIPTSLDLDALTGTISTEQVIDVLVGVVWLAWLHFALCTFVEVLAAVRGGTLAPHVPLGGGSQRLARALVAAMLLSTGIATQASAMVAPPSAGVVGGVLPRRGDVRRLLVGDAGPVGVAGDLGRLRGHDARGRRGDHRGGLGGDAGAQQHRRDERARQPLRAAAERHVRCQRAAADRGADLDQRAEREVQPRQPDHADEDVDDLLGADRAGERVEVQRRRDRRGAVEDQQQRGDAEHERGERERGQQGLTRGLLRRRRDLLEARSPRLRPTRRPLLRATHASSSPALVVGMSPAPCPLMSSLRSLMPPPR